MRSPPPVLRIDPLELLREGSPRRTSRVQGRRPARKHSPGCTGLRDAMAAADSLSMRSRVTDAHPFVRFVDENEPHVRSAQCCVAVGGDSPEALRALELFRKVASPAAVQVIEDFLWLDAQLRRTLRTRLVRSTSSFSPSSTAPQNVVRQARPNRPICD